MSSSRNDKDKDSNYGDDDDTVTAVAGAVQSLRGGVNKIIEKRRTMLEQRGKGGIAGSSSMDVLDGCERRTKVLLLHLQCLLIDLNSKRRSLKSLLEFSRKIEWPRFVSSSLLRHHPVEVLGHTIQLFIRCQDGLMMLTSGECRHKFDIQQVKDDTSTTSNSSNKNKNNSQRYYKFRSRLATLEKRGDGYTSLYKSDAVYTGYGWDEYANETVGIRARLINELKRIGHKDPWNAFERQGRTELLESLLSQHEIQMNTIQQDLQSWKRQILTDIQTQLRPTSLKFVSQDKMERLSITFLNVTKNNMNQSLEFERRANSFQIHGGSLLPHNKKYPNDWKTSLSLEISSPTKTTEAATSSSLHQSSSSSSSQQPKKKRRIIIDSDSDSDSGDNGNENQINQSTRSDGGNNSNEKGKIGVDKPTDRDIPKHSSSNNASKEGRGTTTGLRVKVANTTRQDTTESIGHSSVAAIKAGMGVDTNQLETARESLEQESTVGNTPNSRYAVGSSGNTSSGEDIMSQEERDLLTRERILKRVMSRQVVDENEVWDAREYLRQSAMAAGNYFLWEKANYDRSIECFERAKMLTEEQQAAHRTSSENSNDVDTVEWRITARNLMYLLGQATVNIGITMIVSAEGNTNQMRRNSVKAIEMFEKAQALTCDILGLTKARRGKVSTSQRFSISIEDIFDALKARELDCMASRWMGEALWATGQESKAFDVLKKASNIYDERTIDLNCCELLDVIDLASECIYATDKLAELAYSCLKKIGRTSSVLSPASTMEGDVLMTKIRNAIDRHIEIYLSVQNLGGRFDEDSEIATIAETASCLKEIVLWWNNVKEGKHVSMNQQETTRDPFRRSDLSSIPAPDLLNGNWTATASSRNVTACDEKNGTGNSTNFPRTQNRSNVQRRSSSPFHSKKSKRFGVSTSTSGSAYSPTPKTDATSTTPIMYRKWGDELVKEKNNGSIPFPTTAPSLPPEFQALLDMKKVTIATPVTKNNVRRA